MQKGYFIVFEGGEGGGKSTQIALLATELQKRGVPFLTTREPGGSALGQEVRRWLLHSGAVAPRAELFLYLADRAQHVAQVIRPALEQGKVVLCDRYGDSAVVYQGICRGLGKERVKALNREATGNLRPQRTFVFDVPVDVGLARAGKREALDRMEQESLLFHQKVRKGFLELARTPGGRYTLLDGTEPPAALFARLWRILERDLQKRGFLNGK